MPLVSIVIPVYNGARYLREAIDSALAQTYRNIEIIVVNDGSQDDGRTDAIARSYGDKIRYFLKENGGVSSALNFGARKMQGDFFAWLSHDDVFAPDKISVQVEVAARYSRPVILFSDYDIIDERSRNKGCRKIPRKSTEDIIFGLLTRFPVNGCTTLIPKVCFDNVGLFDEQLRTTQDYDMWMRLALKYDFVHIPLPLLRSRRHPEQGALTIHGHKDAENKLYINLMKNLPADYLHEKIQTRGAAFWYEISWCLRRRYIFQAADYAQERARINVVGTWATLFWVWVDLLARGVLQIRRLLREFGKWLKKAAFR